MSELRGVGIGRGVAAGRVMRMDRAPVLPLDDDHAPPAHRQVQARQALDEVARQLRRLAENAAPEGAEVLHAQALMATDPELAQRVVSFVDGGSGAARAITEALAEYSLRLASAGGYLAARVADLDDIRRRAVAHCQGVPNPGLPRPGHPYVLVAQDLAPADTVLLDGNVLALVTVEGGPTSHTAILARAMGIPAVVGCCGAEDLVDGELVTVDAARGLVLPGASRFTPTAPQRVTGPARTADGHRVMLQANVGSLDDLEAAVAAGAEGVGLLRTEFLDDYRAVFDAFPDGRVVVRVYDAGGDKPLPGLSLPAEPNPAIGLRGLRALRRHPEALDAQLKAIAQAAASSTTDVWVMAPMISEPAEAAWFAARVAEHGLPVAGAMIEVPSAAILAPELLSTVDFASVGTNDLAQFTLAADRQLSVLAHLHDPWHPAVLRLVAAVASAGVAQDKPIGVCGEAAADPRLACVLIGLGVTSLSMAPAAIADVCDELARHTLADCREMAAAALAL